MTTFSHITNETLRKYLQGSPDACDFNRVATIIEYTTKALEQDRQNDNIPFDVYVCREEALASAKVAFAQLDLHSCHYWIKEFWR
jgi:hypothetical protein